MKVHTSALVVIPPPAVWEPIQVLRRRYDRQIARWMPHITLLYPFWPREAFERAAPLVAGACQGCTRFAVELCELRWFAHGRRNFTLWLAPEPPAPMVELQRRLQAAFPECDDVARFAGGFTAHLSLGQASGRAQLEERAAAIRAAWRPLRFEVGAVALIARTRDEPFQVEREIELREG